jgi:hypothetical protein
MRGLKISLAALATLTAVSSLAGCANETTPITGTNTITVYSGRAEDLIAPLLEQFTAETGIAVEVRYAGSAELAAQILEEGNNVRADVFLSQDAGALGALSEVGAFKKLNKDIVDLVDEKFRAADDTWVGVSGRSRVLSYNPSLVMESQLPKSVFDLADPSWKGKIGIAPSNASFQAFVTAMRVLEGPDATNAWLAAMKTNAVIFEKNSQILEAVETGKISVGLINHYYWFERAAEVGKDYPGVTTDKQHIDILSARFVLQPDRFDVVVASNLFGDILSDLGPACTGTIGLAPSANLNPDRKFPSLFEPVHGSAPDIYGKNIANPIAMIWSGALMLDYLGRGLPAANQKPYLDAHDAIVTAIEQVLSQGPHTPDLGGKANTTQIGEAISKVLSK